MYISKITLCAALLAGLPLVSCSNSKDRSDKATDMTASVLEADSIPESVKKLVRVVTDNDSSGFAQLVSYPLQRPYPLHNIDTPEQMSEYYHQLVDDSLRNVILKAGSEKWSEYGWRGWSLDDGRYIWVDENVYDVNYISGAERRHIDSLQRIEIESIEPSIREGWRPMMCLTDPADGSVYRVDTRTSGDANENNHYRLAVYKPASDLSGLPSQLMEGEMEMEGSAGSISYHFHDSHKGSQYVLQPESTESAESVIISPSGDNIVVERAYWHELIKK